MASENAKRVARKVVEKVRKNERINLGDIIEEAGYAASTALSPTKVTNTESYQSELSPFVQKMLRERDRIIAHLETKDLDAVQYQQLTSALDTFTKNIQLLSGKETERAGIVIQTVDYKDV